MDIKIEPIEEDQPDFIDLNLLKTETPEDLQCLICSEIFNCEFLLKVHQMLHDPDEYCFICKRKYPNNIDVHVLGKHFNQCDLCLKTFTEKKAMRRHMELHTGELTYLKCNQCDKIFRQAGSLTVHIRATHQGLKPYTCTQCKVPVRFTTKSALKRHLRKFHDPNRPRKDYIKVHECSFCHEPLKGWKIKREHENQHRACKICKSCDKIFKTTLDLRKHFAVDHATPGWFPCEECWMNFNSTYLLKKHSETHQENKYCCQDCNLFYSNRSSLHKHKKTYHNPDKPPKIDQDDLKCRYCSESFLSIGQRQKHTSRNCGKDKTMCQLCQKRCMSTYSLNRHMRRNHTQLHTCQYCQQQYSKRQLKRHLKSVHQERKCHHCAEVFYIYERYHEHLLSHNVDITCDVCGKDLRRDNIEKHMKKQHQNLNVFKKECKYCRKMVVNLEIHVAKVHTCPLCNLSGKLFTTMGLRVHYKRRHPHDIKCSKCDENLSRSKVRSHMWTVHDRKRFCLCDKCGTFFYDRRRYERHRTRHLVGAIKCLMCSRRFIDEMTFRMHHCVKNTGWTKINAGNPYTHRNHSSRVTLRLRKRQTSEDRLQEVSGADESESRKYRCKTCFKCLIGFRAAKKHHCGENREIGRRKFCKRCGFGFFTKNAASMRDHLLRCRSIKTEYQLYGNEEENFLQEGKYFKVEETEGVGCVVKNQDFL